jgi:hypothetical protein
VCATKLLEAGTLAWMSKIIQRPTTKRKIAYAVVKVHNLLVKKDVRKYNPILSSFAVMLISRLSILTIVTFFDN